MIHRDLHLYLGFFVRDGLRLCSALANYSLVHQSIRKITHRKVSPAEEQSFTTPQWLDVFRQARAANVFRIGTTEVAMQSDQAVGSNKLQHRFALTFGGQVNLALNVRLSSILSRYLS